MTHPITVIATDLDGTLLTTAHEISPRTERALKAAMARGVQVILATGKTMLSREKPVRQLGLTTPGVYSQGLVLINGDGSVRYKRELENRVACLAVRFAEARGLNTVLVTDGGTRILAEKLHTLTDFMTDHHEPDPVIVGPLSAIIDGTPVTKMLIEIPPLEMARVRAELAAQIGDSAELVTSMPQLLEVLPPGASKGDGLRRLLNDMGIDPAEVIAFGDGENDIEMLQLAGIGVAMGNATQHVKDIADYVTASNDDDGVGLAVERFVLDGHR